MKIIIMGVSGTGKSTIGSALASQLGIPFYDADDFHPLANVAKMSSGQPLTDEDRMPWLQILAKQLREWPSAVLACSSLKESYRQVLNAGNNLQWVFLQGSRDTILQRMNARSDHFMKPAMLDSQLSTLEEPAYGLRVSIEQDVHQITQTLTAHFQKEEQS